MIFKDLLFNNKDVSYDEILLAACDYTNSRSQKKPGADHFLPAFAHVLAELARTDVVEEGWTLYVEEEVYEGEKCFDMYGKAPKPNEDGFVGGYGLDFTDWGEFLGMEVDPESLKLMSAVDFCALALWEMTWYGWTNNEVQERKDRIFDERGE